MKGTGLWCGVRRAPMDNAMTIRVWAEPESGCAATLVKGHGKVVATQLARSAGAKALRAVVRPPTSLFPRDGQGLNFPRERSMKARESPTRPASGVQGSSWRPLSVCSACRRHNHDRGCGQDHKATTRAQLHRESAMLDRSGGPSRIRGRSHPHRAGPLARLPRNVLQLHMNCTH